MKLSPNIKLNIVFWAITAPIIPFIILAMTIAILLSVIPPLRNPCFSGIENVVRKFAIWRNNLPIVKNAYDKAHLFDYIKNSNG